MRLLLCFILLLSSPLLFAQNQSVGIGTTSPASSAALDVTSTDKGVLVPRMTSDQRKLISNAATGLLVFDNTTSTFWFRNATAWVELVDSTKQPWQKSGANIYTATIGNVGIGTSAPASKLDVAGTVRATGFAATPSYGGLTIGLSANNATRLEGGISAETNGYSYLQSIRMQGSSWGDLALNADGGNVGIGTNIPAVKLQVNGSTWLQQNLQVDGTAQLAKGLVLDADNTNAGDGVNLLRFGGPTSGEGIGSKRTAGLYQHSLDLYTGGSRRLSVSNSGDVTIGTGTASGRLTVAGDVVAVNGAVKQRVNSSDISNMMPGASNTLTWTHNLGYKPVIMISAEIQDGDARGVSFVYEHVSDNQLRIRTWNHESIRDADIILRWIVVN